MKNKLFILIFAALITLASISLTGCNENDPLPSAIPEVTTEPQQDETASQEETDTEKAEETKEAETEAENPRNEEKTTSEIETTTEKETTAKEKAETETTDLKNDTKEEKQETVKENKEPVTNAFPAVIPGNTENKSSSGNNNASEKEPETHEKQNAVSQNVNVVQKDQNAQMQPDNTAPQQPYFVYEEVTAVADDYYQYYDYNSGNDNQNAGSTYISPQVECNASPNGYHSWTDVYEWYNGDQLINTGPEPAGGFTSSVYLYSYCDHCGARY